jgi:hypothetical protein
MVYCSRVMKMYRYTEEDRAIIAAARKANKDTGLVVDLKGVLP